MRTGCFGAGVVLASAVCLAQTAIPPVPRETLWEWPASEREAYAKTESDLLAVPAPASLRSWHDLLASEPHIAGTPGDARNIQRLVDAFSGMGLEVRKHEFWAYLCRPVASALEVVEPEKRTLVLKENILADDPYSANPAQTPGWNAYSGNGDITSGVVYANYGTKADFARLAELGVEVKGRIVIARYGGNFRGYKAKFAEAAGAAGLIIYTDPADSGYVKGLMYPEGGYANDTCIERGSLLTLDYIGDPLTPGAEATKDAPRLDPAAVALPKIPVQPVSWSAAVEIMKRMTGPAVPTTPPGWQGGLPLPYRVSGGEALKVRLMVKQERAVMPTANVIATLPGSEHPEQKVVIGCHHDAWGCGASDPLSGTIALVETARAFAEMAHRGVRPARTVVFAAWAAEEFGIIGSSEWVERNRDDLTKNAVAYLNLDMASMGVDCGASGSPSLRRVLADTARAVPQARDTSGKTVFDLWLARSPDDLFPGRPRLGDMGGGSDHVGFLCHAGVPAGAFGAGGSPGTAYHSIYDTLVWYRKVVGDDYEPALMITRFASAVVSRLAGGALVPLDPVAVGLETRRQLVALTTRAYEIGALQAGAGPKREVAAQFLRLEGAAMEYDARAREVHARVLEAVGAGKLGGNDLQAVNTELMALDRAWLTPEGLPGRSWFRNLYVSPDKDSGYASWALPLLRATVEAKDWDAAERAEDVYLAVFARLTAHLDRIKTIINGTQKK